MPDMVACASCRDGEEVVWRWLRRGAGLARRWKSHYRWVRSRSWIFWANVVLICGGLRRGVDGEMVAWRVFADSTLLAAKVAMLRESLGHVPAAAPDDA